MSNSRGICEVRKASILILHLTLDTDDAGNVGGDNQITDIGDDNAERHQRSQVGGQLNRYMID